MAHTSERNQLTSWVISSPGAPLTMNVGTSAIWASHSLTWMSSLQILKNGNLVLGNFLRGQEGKGAHVFEITREKKVVWKWADHDMVKSLTTMRVLDD